MDELTKEILDCLPIEGNYADGGGYIDCSREEMDDMVEKLEALIQRELLEVRYESAGVWVKEE